MLIYQFSYLSESGTEKTNRFRFLIQKLVLNIGILFKRGWIHDSPKLSLFLQSTGKVIVEMQELISKKKSILKNI